MGNKNTNESKESRRGKNAVKYVKTHKLTFILLAVVIVGVVGWGILQSPISLTNGFLTVRIRSANGFRVGTGTGGEAVGFTDAGYFYIPGANGVMWRGYAQLGNLQVANSTWLGWQIIGNTSISVTKYYFSFDTMVYTTSKPFDIIPYSTSSVSCLQYLASKGYNMFGDYNVVTQGFLSIPSLTIPTVNDPTWGLYNYTARLATMLNLDVELEIEMNPTLLGQGLSAGFTNGNGTYSKASYIVDSIVLHADPSASAQAGGYLSQPNIVFTNVTFGTTPQANNVSASLSAPIPYAGQVDVITDISMRGKDGLSGSDHFKVTTTDSILATSSVQMKSLSALNASITVLKDTNITDLSQTKLTGHLPFLLQPKTTIMQTTYGYKSWNIISLVNSLPIIPTVVTASYTSLTVTYPSRVNTNNVYAIQRTQGYLVTKTNYTWTPPADNITVSFHQPLEDGTNGSLDPLPYDSTVNPTGTLSTNPVDISGWFGTNWYWFVIAGIAVIVVVYYLWKSMSRRNDTNVNKMSGISRGPEQQRIQQPYGNVPSPNLQYKSPKTSKMKTL
jgi:hypothetical protein